MYDMPLLVEVRQQIKRRQEKRFTKFICRILYWIPFTRAWMLFDANEAVIRAMLIHHGTAVIWDKRFQALLIPSGAWPFKRLMASNIQRAADRIVDEFIGYKPKRSLMFQHADAASSKQTRCDHKSGK